MLGLLLVVLGTLWSGAGLAKTAWAEGEGEEAVLEEGLCNQGCVQAQGSQSCCLLPERGPRKSGNDAAPVRSGAGG